MASLYLSWRSYLQLSSDHLSLDLNNTLKSTSGGLRINWTRTQSQMARLAEVDSFQSENVISRTGCHLPDMDPWDQTVRKYVQEIPKVTMRRSRKLTSSVFMKVSCRTDQKSLLFVRSNRIILNQSAISEINKDNNSITCYYQYIKYISDEEYSFEEKIKIDENETELSELYNSVFATCSSTISQTIYENIFIYVPQLGNMIEREDPTKYSVVLLILDSLSRLMFLRSVVCCMVKSIFCLSIF